MKSQARPRRCIGVKVTSLTTYVCLSAIEKWIDLFSKLGSNGSDFDSNASARQGLALHIIVIWQQSTNPSHWIWVGQGGLKKGKHILPNSHWFNIKLKISVLVTYIRDNTGRFPVNFPTSGIYPMMTVSMNVNLSKVCSQALRDKKNSHTVMFSILLMSVDALVAKSFELQQAQKSNNGFQ